MKLATYSQYKSSKIKWIGDIPDHWSLKKLKYITKNYDGKRIPLSGTERSDRTGDYPYYGATGIIDYVDDYIFDGEYILIGEDGAPFFEKNRDVAFIASNKFWVNNHAHILKATDGLVQKIIVYQLNCVEYKEYISGSTRDKLTQDELKEIVLPFIPLSEQRSIAAFLDYKTAQIDNLIEKKEQLIKLLEEKCIALITQAVTGHIPLLGGDEGVGYKDSSIPWLGDIPKHWKVLPLKYIVSTPITDGPHETPELYDEGIPFISAEAIRNEEIDFNRKRGFISVEDHLRFSKKYYPKRNDIYVIKSGATTGNVAMVDTDTVFNIWSPLAAIRTDNSQALPHFVFYFLKSECFRTSVILGWSFGTQQNIGMDVIENLIITMPPLSEQEQIINLLEKEITKLKSLASSIAIAIEKLKEYRTSLITSAVTGKIDVRNFSQTQLPVSRGDEGVGKTVL